MARLTVGWPVVGARTSDGMDAIQSLDPSVYATTIGLGTMSLQNAGSVNISGGNISNVDIIAGSINAVSISVDSLSADSANISGGNISNVNITDSYITDVTMGVVGSGVAFSGTVEAFSFQASTSMVVGDIVTVPYGGVYVGMNDTAASEWIYMWHNPGSGYARIAVPNGSDLWIHTESAFGEEDGQDIMFYSASQNRVEFWNSVKFASNIGFYGTTPIAKITVAAPAAVVTTETAGGTYTSNEQTMLANLKTDVTNLRTKLNEAIAALKSYGLIG